jgi:hypothetical protein
MGLQKLHESFGQTKNQLGSEPNEQDIVKTLSDSIRIEEGPVVVQTATVSSTAFIIDNTHYGILGTNKLTVGTGYNTAGVVEVRNNNNEFIERFNFDLFKDSGTTATWGDGKVTFANTHIAQSLSCYKGTTTVSFATLILDDVTNLTLYLSANGGTNWEQVTNNVQHNFTKTGKDLRFKIIASGSAEISTLRIRYG